MYNQRKGYRPASLGEQDFHLGLCPQLCRQHWLYVTEQWTQTWTLTTQASHRLACPQPAKSTFKRPPFALAVVGSSEALPSIFKKHSGHQSLPSRNGGVSSATPFISWGYSTMPIRPQSLQSCRPLYLGTVVPALEGRAPNPVSCPRAENTGPSLREVIGRHRVCHV